MCAYVYPSIGLHYSYVQSVLLHQVHLQSWEESWSLSEIEGAIAYCKWRARLLDIPLYYPRRGIMLQVTDSGSCEESH